MKFGYSHDGLSIDVFVDSDKLDALSEGAVILENITNLVRKERDAAIERVGSGLCDKSLGVNGSDKNISREDRLKQLFHDLGYDAVDIEQCMDRTI